MEFLYDILFIMNNLYMNIYRYEFLLSSKKILKIFNAQIHIPTIPFFLQGIILGMPRTEGHKALAVNKVLCLSTCSASNPGAEAFLSPCCCSCCCLLICIYFFVVCQRNWEIVKQLATK